MSAQQTDTQERWNCSLKHAAAVYRKLPIIGPFCHLSAMGLSLDFKLPHSSDDFMLKLKQDPHYYIGAENSELIADFSFHILPKHLDLLSEGFGQAMKLPLRRLRPYLVPIQDEPGYGVLLVNREWVEYASAVPMAEASNIVERWAAKLDFPVRDYHERAVDDLIKLCSSAIESERPVLHTWCG